MIPSRLGRALLVGALCWPLVTRGSAGAQCVRLDGLDDARVGEGLPPGWSLRAVSGERRPRAEVVELDGVPALLLESDSAAGQAWRELDTPIPVELGHLEWFWRVTGVTPGAVLEDATRDDAPARLFLSFGGGGFLGRPRMLFYTWGRDEDIEHGFISHVSDRVGVVVLRNAEGPFGAWVRESRNVFDDFVRVFGRAPDEVRAVGFMNDTDQTGGHAVAHLRGVRWNPDPPGSSNCGEGLRTRRDEAR